MVDRIRGPFSEYEGKTNILPPAYAAKNLEDFVTNRDRFLQWAIEDYQGLRARFGSTADLGIGGRFLARNFLIGNPVQSSSILGRFRYETVMANAFVAVPTVRHYPERDKSKKEEWLTLFDARGEIDAQLPELFWEKILSNIKIKGFGFRVLPSTVLKNETWASDVVLFCTFLNRNGKSDDHYYLIHAGNKHLGGRGKMIPTLMAELKELGFSFDPQGNS